jgi:hypothetical protein
MRAGVHRIVISALAGCVLSGCGGASGHPRATSAPYLNMRFLSSTFKGQEYPALHSSPTQGGPYEAHPTQVTCTKTGSLDATCVLTFWPIRYNSSGIEYRYVKQGASRFKVTVKIAPDGKTIEPSIPQKEGPEEKQ